MYLWNDQKYWEVGISALIFVGLQPKYCEVELLLELIVFYIKFMFMFSFVPNKLTRMCDVIILCYSAKCLHIFV